MGGGGDELPEWYARLSSQTAAQAGDAAGGEGAASAERHEGGGTRLGARAAEPSAMDGIMARQQRNAARVAEYVASRYACVSGGEGEAQAPQKRARAPTSAVRPVAVAPPAPAAPMAHSGLTARQVQEEAMWERLRGIGLTGALGERVDDMYVSGRVGGADAVASLRERARRKVLATWNLGRIGSMAAWWEDFLMTTDRVPFVALATTGDLAGAIYNAQTLELFAEFIRDRGSRAKGHTGEPLTADYISTLVATARLVRSGEAHYNVAPSEASTSISTMFKSMREEDGPRGGNERRESRGFRARDFKAIAASFDRLTHMGLMEWTVALTAWNMLLRGGEVGRPTGKIFDASIGITVAGVQMREPCAASGMRPWLTVDVTSIKDQKRRNRPVPVPVAQRGGGVAGGDDALCVYTHVKAVYERRCRQLPKCAGACNWCKRESGNARPAGRPPASCARANAPLFTRADGEAFDTTGVAALGRRMAVAAGMRDAVTGGKLWRIGGATDLWETVGEAKASAHIKRRGRWKTDVWEHYQRTLLGQQIEAAGSMADATDVDIEAMCPGWVQPASA